MAWLSRTKPTAEKSTSASFFPRVVDIAVTTPNGELKRMILTKEVIEQVIKRVNSDPLAGLGVFTKEEELVNELMKVVNTCDLPEQKQLGTAAPILSEPKTPAPKALRSVPSTTKTAETLLGTQPPFNLGGETGKGASA